MLSLVFIYALVAVSVASWAALVYSLLLSIVKMNSIARGANDMLFVKSANFSVESSKILVIYSIYFSLLTLLSVSMANMPSTSSIGLISEFSALIEIVSLLLIALILSLLDLAGTMSPRLLPSLAIFFFSSLFLMSVMDRSSTLFSYAFEFAFLLLFLREFIFVNRKNSIPDNTYLTIEAEGESMEPVIESGDTLVLLTPTKGVFLKEGDIVAYSRLNINTLEQMLISHRLINITGHLCTLKGDNLADVERISVRSIRGLVAAAFRQGKISYENKGLQTDQRILSWDYANTLNGWPAAIRVWNRLEPKKFVTVLLVTLVLTASLFII